MLYTPIPNVTVARDEIKTTVFFKRSSYRPSEEELSKFMQNNSFQNRCSYGDIKHLNIGEVTICFNPLVHPLFTREEVEQELIQLIANSAVSS